MNKKSLSPIALILFLSVSIAAFFQPVNLAKANWMYVPETPIKDPPIVVVQSPISNNTYAHDLALNFSVTKPKSWGPNDSKPLGGIRSIDYNLNGQDYNIYTAKSQVPFDELSPTSNFSISLEGLSNGTNSLKLVVVGATFYRINPTPPPNWQGPWTGYGPFDKEYYMKTTLTTNFEVNSSLSPSPAPTPSLSTIPSPTPTHISTPTEMAPPSSSPWPTASGQPASSTNPDQSALQTDLIYAAATAAAAIAATSTAAVALMRRKKSNSRSLSA